MSHIEWKAVSDRSVRYAHEQRQSSSVGRHVCVAGGVRAGVPAGAGGEAAAGGRAAAAPPTAAAPPRTPPCESVATHTS